MALVKYNNNSISTISSAGQLASGSLVPIKSITASDNSHVSFVHGSGDVVLDSTYPIYKFEFINIHPSIDSTSFGMNFSVDSGSNYNVAKTTTFFYAFHNEADSSTQLTYDSSVDLAQGTGVQYLTFNIGNDNDQSASGEMFLFNPSSTTFVKHFISRIPNGGYNSNGMLDSYASGYGNTQSPINAIRFTMSSGAIGSGTIKLYGIKDS